VTDHELPPSFEIAGREIGPDKPCYVIAEAGSNHNRDFGIARELIEVAHDAGADAVKFQVYSGSSLYSARTPSFEYLDDDRPVQEILEEASLPRDWIPRLAAECEQRQLTFLATPFDDRAIAELDAAGVPAFKIASFEIVDLELIRKVAERGRPVILSTGMATYGEIDDAIQAAVAGSAEAIALLRCASLYPASPEIMNLRAMRTMRIAYRVPVGLSDHTTGIAVPTGAAALGMDILEKHFTLDRTMQGPDHRFALEPDELRAMISAVHEVEAALGTGRIDGPSEEERREMYALARRSVVAVSDIPAGTVITREQLTVKRPGWGIPPKQIEMLVGRTARRQIEADDVITWDMI
jgi:sialic acid synthase SpsE